MTVVIVGVGSDKGFAAACKAMEYRHKIYGVDTVDLAGTKYSQLVREAPGCYYKQMDLSNEMLFLWEVSTIKPEMIVDCTSDPKQSAVVQNVCTQKHWEYKRV
ncbi:MAG: hypothetical protein J5847_05445 [Clostridia bacterium]|nr:hypothetical protein [Clostridia bacterium]